MKIVFFLKSRLLFNVLLFLYVCKNLSGALNSKIKCCYNVKLSAYYFYVNTKRSVGFQICTSVPLSKAFYFVTFKIKFNS